jgi:hypothetical protein
VEGEGQHPHQRRMGVDPFRSVRMQTLPARVCTSTRLKKGVEEDATHSAGGSNWWWCRNNVSPKFDASVSSTHLNKCGRQSGGIHSHTGGTARSSISIQPISTGTNVRVRFQVTARVSVSVWVTVCVSESVRIKMSRVRVKVKVKVRVRVWVRV